MFKLSLGVAVILPLADSKRCQNQQANEESGERTLESIATLFVYGRILGIVNNWVFCVVVDETLFISGSVHIAPLCLSCLGFLCK